MLAPHLPLALPEQVALGEPTRGLPVPLVGRPLVRPASTPADDNVDLVRAAEDLAEFVVALQQVDTTGGPVKTGTSRGAPLENLADTVDEHVRILDGEIDGARARRVFEIAPGRGPVAGRADAGCTATCSPGT